MIKLRAAALIPILVISLIAPASGGVRLRVFGQMNFAAASGSEDSYQVGVNEFPLSGSHRTPGFGIGLINEKGLFFYGVEISAQPAGRAVLTDPSDGDTVEIDTSRYSAGMLVLGLNLLRGSGPRVFLEGGGGAAATLDKDPQVLTSSLGYETEIAAPDREFPLVFFAGAGVDIPLSKTLSIHLGGRYRYFNFHDPQTVVVARAGLSLVF